MTNIAIRVENLSKRYRIGEREPYGALRDVLTNAMTAPFRRLRSTLQRSNVETFKRSNEFIWALKDVSFEVKRGEVIGIIGRNGAGKTTLLKILSRITEPTEGYAEIHGRVGSLLEVGTGFHPELTGRENVYLNGAILGMRKVEIERKFDEIVAFAEIERFLDTPVKRYSSGMFVRLAFAVAAHLEPEILLVDEVLAVGDAAFQKKCLGKMGDVAKEGRTVLFVSHQMNAIRTLCRKCLLLTQGKITDYGDVERVIPRYLQLDSTENEWISDGKSRVSNPYFNPTRFAIVDRQLNCISRAIRADEEFGVLIEGVTDSINISLTVGFAVYAASGELLFWALHTDRKPEMWPAIRTGHNKLVCWIPRHFVNEGDYRIELIVSLHYVAWLSQPGVNAPSVHIAVRGGLSESPYWMMARPGLLAPVLPFTSIG